MYEHSLVRAASAWFELRGQQADVEFDAAAAAQALPADGRPRTKRG